MFLRNVVVEYLRARPRKDFINNTWDIIFIDIANLENLTVWTGWLLSTGFMVKYHFDGLVQDCSNSIANALELLQSCTEPSVYSQMPTQLGNHSSPILPSSVRFWCCVGTKRGEFIKPNSHDPSYTTTWKYIRHNNYISPISELNQLMYPPQICPSGGHYRAYYKSSTSTLLFKSIRIRLANQSDWKTYCPQLFNWLVGIQISDNVPENYRQKCLRGNIPHLVKHYRSSEPI